jgi:hypothetical protein
MPASKTSTVSPKAPKTTLAWIMDYSEIRHGQVLTLANDEAISVPIAAFS